MKSIKSIYSGYSYPAQIICHSVFQNSYAEEIYADVSALLVIKLLFCRCIKMDAYVAEIDANFYGG